MPVILGQTVTLETALWIFGMILIPTVGWAIHMTILALNACRLAKEAVTMLSSRNGIPAASAAQTAILSAVQDNVRAINALTHYVKWHCEEMSGKKPPPPNGPNMT